MFRCDFIIKCLRLKDKVGKINKFFLTSSFIIIINSPKKILSLVEEKLLRTSFYYRIVYKNVFIENNY